MLKKYIFRAALAAGICIVTVCSACSADESSQADTADTEIETLSDRSASIDIISAVTDEEIDRQTISGSLTENASYNYQRILNGISEGYYYLQDITGDGTPELIAGDIDMSVYSCDSGEIKTLGTVSGNNVRYSDEYGILTENVSSDVFELHSYRYDNGLMNDTVLVSEDSREAFTSAVSGILKTTKALIRFDISDRTVFST